MNRWMVTVLVVCGGCGVAPAAARPCTVWETFSKTDLSLAGAGFFELRDGLAAAFTRDGHFRLDPTGFLLGPGAYRLQGFSGDTLQLSDLRIRHFFEAVPTTRVALRANLRASDPLQVFTPENPSDPSSSSYGSTITIYDALGMAYTVDMYWSHERPDGWHFHAMTDGGAVRGGIAGIPVEVSSGTLEFDTDGKLTSVTQASRFEPLSAEQPQPLTFSLGTPTQSGGLGLDGVTQFDAPGSTTSVEGDGRGFGQIADLEIDGTGGIQARYTNGMKVDVGRIAVAQFPAPAQLSSLPSHLRGATLGSGAPVLTTGMVGILSGSLEEVADDCR